MDKTILFVCEGKQHLAVAHKLASVLKNAQFNTALFWPHEFDDNLKFKIFDNIINDLTVIPGFLQGISTIIFFTLDSVTSGLVSLKIAYIAKKTNTPCLLFQHGFLQPGLNFKTNYQEVGRISTGSDISKSIYQFSESVKFTGDKGIGYPLISSKNKKINPIIHQQSNILITTNFNWTVYKNEDIVAFLRGIRTLKDEYPYLNFLHKPHPSENPSQIKNSIGIYLSDLGIKQSHFNDLNKALYWADIVITTPSTTILDSISLNRLPLIFSPPIFENYLNDFNSLIYYKCDNLLQIFNSVLTSKKEFNIPTAYHFNESLFINIINESSQKNRLFVMTEEMYLDYLDYL